MVYNSLINQEGKSQKEKNMKKQVLTKVQDFNGNVFYVERKRIQIERVREYGEIENTLPLTATDTIDTIVAWVIF